MSNDGTNFRELFTRSLAKVAELKAEIARLQSAANTPIAVIGMACRFPGGGIDPEAYWQSLESGVDGIKRIPPTRWKVRDTDPPGAKWAGLLESIDGFDAAFFRISPREATVLDPQQRMFLELCWEALEQAGQPVETLVGSSTGVFLGMANFDYAMLTFQERRKDAHVFLGAAASTASGRISNFFGFQGPSLTLDTACSSSLVAIHLACQSLRAGESNLAVAGGVNVIAARDGIFGVASLQAMSTEGRCKTFDAEANGFVLGEGCGIVVLKRLADAQRDGDPILAVIRSTVANQDGKTSGMTVPNVLSQQALLRQALKDAQLQPEDIGFVETHGTATPLGDPIEFEALRAVYGKPRADGSTCSLGAVKTNFGHLSGAAGVAGFIKAVQCIRHQAIPPNLHFKSLNPRMSMTGTPFVLPSEKGAWSANGKIRRAGVSSFGMSGTNAHAILEEYPAAEEKPVAAASLYALPLSARSREALVATAKSWQTWLSKNDEPLHHIAYTASVRRNHLEYRATLIGSNRNEIEAALETLATGDSSPNIIEGKAALVTPKVVFVFPGQGSQWVGMGRQLSREEPAFRDALVACDQAIRKEAGYSILEELDKPEESTRFSDIDVLQPLLFAIEVALAALWRSWGIEPAAVVGHSMGEVAAAFVAGALSIEHAAMIICRRSRLLRGLSGQGAMALVELTLPNAEKALAGYEGRLSVAVSNGPQSTVIAGDPAALDEVSSRLEQDGIFCRRVKVDIASHSPQMDPLRSDLLHALALVSPKIAELPMYSTVTGERVRGDELTATYWADNLRKPVLFSKVAAQCIAEKHTIFLELSPHPILTSSIEENLREAKVDGLALASVRRAQDERKQALSSLGALFTRGVRVGWKSFFPNGGRVVPLPPYPWQRERYWLEVSQDDDIPQKHASSTEDLLHAVHWEPTSAPTNQRSPQAGTCLLFLDDTAVGTALVAALEARNQQCVLVRAGKEYSALDAQVRIDPTNPDDYRRLLDECLAKNTSRLRVVHLWNLDATPFEESTADTLDADLVRGTLSVNFLTRALADRTWSEPPKFCLVTRGAHVVDDKDTAISPIQGAVWGLGSSIILSQSDWETVLIDLSYAAGEGDVDSLAQEILMVDSGQTHVAFRSGTRYAARLIRHPQSAGTPKEIKFRSDATYLVTGGLGGVGQELARWMVEKGARNMVLVSRRAPNEQTRQTIAAMEEKGAKVLAVNADVSNRDDVARLMATIAEKMPPLRGLMHAAGLPPTVLETTRESLLSVAAPKVRGGWNLHEATRGLDLDFFVLYSSASALLGLLAGTEYAVANAFLFALALARHKQGLPALGVQWGVFGEAGLHVQLKGEAGAYGALDPMMLHEAHDALAVAMAEQRTVTTIMRFSPQRHYSIFPHVEKLFLWSALQGDEKPTTKAIFSTTDRRLIEKLINAKADLREQRLTAYLQNVLSRIVHLDPQKIPMDATLHTLGMDSLMCLELRNAIEKDLGIHIPIKDILASADIGVFGDLLGRRLWSDGVTEATQTNDTPGNWVVVPRARPDAIMRLICFPYAGGNASVYSSWVDRIGSKVELCAIQPPGRQERIHESLLETVEQMVEGIVPALLPYLDKPFAMFGHCVGAMVMYEVVRVLKARHGLAPVHIFPSGALPPKNYLIPAVDTSLDSDKFVETLRQIGFAEDSVLGDEESARELLPTVSADFDLAIRYACDRPSALDAPITTICGREDQLGPPERTVKWNEMTTSRFDQVVLPGEHYFLVPERNAVIRTVNEELDNYVAIFEQRREPSRWLQRNAPRNDAAMRLFCFPGVWENPAVFDDWPALLGNDVEVCVIERAGHGASRTRTPFRRIDDMMEFLVPAIEPYLDRPFVFLGHDLGSIIMFETTRSLRRRGKPIPAHLIVCATNAPHLYWSGPTHLVTKEKLLEGIRATEVKLDARVSDDVLMAEAAMMATYIYTDEALLDKPITAIIGKHDRFVPHGAFRGWRGATTGPFDMHVIDADHNVIVDKNMDVIERVREVCQVVQTAKPEPQRKKKKPKYFKVVSGTNKHR